MSVVTLLAARPIDIEELLVPAGLLAGALLLSALIIWQVDRLRKKRALMPDTNPADSLTSFRAMFDNGELTREEYDAIRARLAERIKRKMHVTGPTVVSSTPDGQPPQGPPPKLPLPDNPADPPGTVQPP